MGAVLRNGPDKDVGVWIVSEVVSFSWACALSGLFPSLAWLRWCCEPRGKTPGSPKARQPRTLSSHPLNCWEKALLLTSMPRPQIVRRRDDAFTWARTAAGPHHMGGCSDKGVDAGADLPEALAVWRRLFSGVCTEYARHPIHAGTRVINGLLVGLAVGSVGNAGSETVRHQHHHQQTAMRANEWLVVGTADVGAHPFVASSGMTGRGDVGAVEVQLVPNLVGIGAQRRAARNVGWVGPRHNLATPPSQRAPSSSSPQTPDGAQSRFRPPPKQQSSQPWNSTPSSVRRAERADASPVC